MNVTDHRRPAHGLIARLSAIASAIVLGLFALLVGGVVVSALSPHPLALPVGLLVSFGIIATVSFMGPSRSVRNR